MLAKKKAFFYIDIMSNLFKNLDRKDCRIGFRISTTIEKEIKSTAKKHDIAIAKVVNACLDAGLNQAKELSTTVEENDSDSKGTTIVINISQEFLDRINDTTKKLKLKQSELLRRALIFGLKSA